MSDDVGVSWCYGIIHRVREESLSVLPVEENIIINLQNLIRSKVGVFLVLWSCKHCFFHCFMKTQRDFSELLRNPGKVPWVPEDIFSDRYFAAKPR